MRRAFIFAAAVAISSCNDSGSSSNGVAPDPQAPVAFEGAAAAPPMRVRHGERLTYVLGCRGCHGSGLEGRLWDHDPRGYGVMWASNLTRAVPGMTDPQLRDLLIRGIHPHRADLWVMPSEMFQHLAEPDLAALIAYLRTMAPTGAASPDPRPGPRARREIASGEAKPAATLVRELRATLPADSGPRYKLGRYIASVTCAECHGHRLEGHRSEEGSTPDLTIVSAYSREEFERLVTRGEAKDGRRIAELMVGVARGRFSHLTQGERDALYAYLRARAGLAR
jgi:cytochrome c553